MSEERVFDTPFYTERRLHSRSPGLAAQKHRNYQPHVSNSTFKDAQIQIGRALGKAGRWAWMAVVGSHSFYQSCFAVDAEKLIAGHQAGWLQFLGAQYLADAKAFETRPCGRIEPSIG